MGYGLTRGKFRGWRHHPTTVAIDGRVNTRQRTRCQIRLPPTGTIADDTNFAVEIRQGTEMANGSLRIPHGAVIWHAPGGTDAGAIFLGRGFALTVVQVR